MSEALYRKYRPQVFEDVVGQNHIERTIRNAIEQDKVSHAYLFCGPRGTGKTTTARLLAKALLCEKAPTPEPDGTCEDCRLIAAGEHPDVYELDAASRTGVDNVREEIIGRVQFAPTRGSKKVYIIDEVHMLSTAAFNALLKTLEEPPSHVVFILCTTDPQKVPETIHSRCQRFDFRRIGAEEMVSRLGAICVSEGVEFEGDALDLIAHRAEGGMRNALTALEQAIAYGAGHVTLEVVESLVGSLDTSDMAEIVCAIGHRDVAACFTWVASYVETGADLAQFARDLAEHVRNMYVLSLAGPDAPAGLSDAERREIADELPLFGPERLARMLGVLGDVIAEFKTTTNARLTFEIALTRMVRPESDLTLSALAERIEELERKLAAATSGQVMPSVATPVASRPVVQRPQPQPAQHQQLQPAQQSQQRQPNPFTQTERPACDTPALQAGQARSRVEQPAQVASRPQPQAMQQATPQPERASQSVQQQAASSVEAGGQPSDRVAAELSNPAALQRMWQAVQAAIKREKAAYAVLLLNTRAVYDPSTKIVAIEFPAESAFAFKAVQKPDVNDAVEQAFAQVAGERVAFAFTKDSAASQRFGASRPQAQPMAQQQRSEPRQTMQRPTRQPVAQQPAVQQSAAEQPAEQRPSRTQAPAPSQVRQTSDSADEMPVDMYDDIAYDMYGAEGYEQFHAGNASSASIPSAHDSSVAGSAGASSQPGAQQKAKPAYEASAQPGFDRSNGERPASTQPASSAATAPVSDGGAARDELARMLTETFGAPVSVEEV